MGEGVTGRVRDTFGVRRGGIGTDPAKAVLVGGGGGGGTGEGDSVGLRGRGTGTVAGEDREGVVVGQGEVGGGLRGEGGCLALLVFLVPGPAWALGMMGCPFAVCGDGRQAEDWGVAHSDVDNLVGFGGGVEIHKADLPVVTVTAAHPETAGGVRLHR